MLLPRSPPCVLFCDHWSYQQRLMASSRRRRSQEPPCGVGGCSGSSVRKQAGHHTSLTDGRRSCASCRNRPCHGRTVPSAGPGRSQQAQRGSPPYRGKELTRVRREDRREVRQEDGRKDGRDDGLADGCGLPSAPQSAPMTIVDDATSRQMTGYRGHLCPVAADKCTRSNEDVTHGGKAATCGIDSAQR